MLLDNFYVNTGIILLFSYLIGSIPSAYIAGRIKKVDLYNVGSRNLGGMNTFTQVDKFAGILVIIADTSKGALAAYMAAQLSQHPFIPLLAVIAAVIGHNWIIYIGFKGGKGVSTFIGGLLFLSPLSFLFFLLLFMPAALFLTRDVYIAFVLANFSFSLFLWYREGSYYWLIFGLLVTLIISIKSYGLLKTYFTEDRRELNHIIKKMFKPIFRRL